MSARPTYTEQQSAAILTRGVSVALSAGAGCGKTFVLTQRFLQQLEPGPESAELSSLVAITFTDRAAREMRDRVREACQSRLRDCAGAAVAHWLTVLRGLDTARISTIHSFCTSLLRSNAVESALDPRFSVLEPPLADALLQTAAETVIHKLLIDDDADAVAFVVRFGLERTRELVSQLASHRFRVDWQAWDGVTPESLTADWIRRWEAEFVPRLIRDFRQGSTPQAVRELLTVELPEHPVMRQRCAELLTGLDPSTPWEDPQAELATLRDAARVQGGGSKSVWSSEDVFEQVKELLTRLRGEIDRLVDDLGYELSDVELSAEFACRGMRLAREVADAYETSKRQAGTLDFDDLLLRARDLLRDHPEVRRRFAQGIRMLMVDEFQDTDPVQAEIVRSLCGEALKHGKLFLVGDIKQSIYRFRRADPRVFRALSDELPEPGRMSLTRNFRSQPAILNFVNALFRTEFAHYEALHPFRDEQLSPQPAVEFLFATFDADESVEDAVAKPNAQQLRQREANWMARRIAELLADDTPRIRSKNPATGATELRRVRPGDITILFRALSNVQEYESALRDYGLDYYLVGGKAFFAQQEVFDILNLCRCLDDPDDSVALLGVLRSPMFGLSDDALHALLPENGDWFNRLVQPPPEWLPEFQRHRIAFAGKTLHELRAQKDRVTIAQLLREAVQCTGYDAALLLEFLGSRKVANLRKLIDQAATFDRSELFTLQDYVERLQSSVLEETDEEFATTLPESGDVIRLMTIHQSKGLEFPVVIVADIDRKRPPQSAGATLHPEWGALISLPTQFGVKHENLAIKMRRIEETAEEDEESLRLFYVALTRAADHLIVSAGVEPGAKRTSLWLTLLERKFDLQTGFAKGDALLATTLGASGRHEIPEVLVHREPANVPRPKKTGGGLPLSDFVSRLVTAEPQPLPESTQSHHLDNTGDRSWSVSLLEQFDALTQPVVEHLSRGVAGRLPSLSSAEELGSLVHAMLERLDYARLDEWGGACDAAQRGWGKPLDENVAEVARELVQAFAGSALAENCAAARQRFREVDFVLPWPAHESAAGKTVITGQIDLCFETLDGVWHIVDFKTQHAMPGSDDAALLAPYTFQLGVYALALEAWLRQSVGSVSLVLLRPEVREITLRWDAESRVEIQQRITRAVLAARTSALPVETAAQE